MGIRSRIVYEKFFIARKNFLEQERAKVVGRNFYNFEYDRKVDIVEFVRKCYWEDGLLPREIAEQIGVSLSALYRFMDKFEIRKDEDK